jgi:LmbE family N-acetylglucosaminyl deacetylase
MNLNILAVGAHPDDIELGCGGLLLKAVSHGHNVFAYTLTRGYPSGDSFIRIQEFVKSAEFMGVRTAWIDNFEDTKLELSSTLINHIEYFVNKSKADVIYTHSKNDTHHDHRAIAESTLEAARYVPNILSYEMPVTKDFNPQVYYDISDVIDSKIKLINIFLSQKDKMFIKSNAIKGLAQYRALQSRLGSSITAVEAFEVLKLGFANDFRLLNFESTTDPKHLGNIDDVIEYCPAITKSEEFLSRRRSLER